ncbi:MAG TPA: SDR family oxidoreductase [Gemmatimonadaceae bacterium]|nr:SDR family oxidoreductase [Gemmatimonadaceae bacterium]
MILVAGATGYLGGEICRRLVAAKRPVRGLVRRTSDGAAIERLREWGVETVVGDLRDPLTLADACRDVEAVVSTVTSMRTRQDGDGIESTDQQGQLNLVDAAANAAVKRFVYVSYSGHVGEDDPLTVAKRSVEQRLQESGMEYVILRPTYFMEAWLGPMLGFDYDAGQVTVYGSGERKISWISLGDVAEFAVRVVDDPKAANSVIELGGPEALSPREVVRVFEEESGRTFRVQQVPEDAIASQPAADSFQRAFSSLMRSYARGDEIPMADTLKRYPVDMTPVRAYARQAVGSRKETPETTAR